MVGYARIRVPVILDDPVVGRCSTFSILGLFNPISMISGVDHIVIENGKIGLKRAFESRPREAFDLDEIEKILLARRSVSPFGPSGKWDIWGKNGVETEISLVLDGGEKHVLIPRLLVRFGKRDWDRFINELCRLTDLPLEEMTGRSS